MYDRMSSEQRPVSPGTAHPGRCSDVVLRFVPTPAMCPLAGSIRLPVLLSAHGIPYRVCHPAELLAAVEAKSTIPYPHPYHTHTDIVMTGGAFSASGNDPARPWAVAAWNS